MIACASARLRAWVGAGMTNITTSSAIIASSASAAGLLAAAAAKARSAASRLSATAAGLCTTAGDGPATRAHAVSDNSIADKIAKRIHIPFISSEHRSKAPIDRYGPKLQASNQSA